MEHSVTTFVTRLAVLLMTRHTAYWVPHLATINPVLAPVHAVKFEVVSFSNPFDRASCA